MRIGLNGINEDNLMGLRGSAEVAEYTSEVDSDELFHEITGLIDPRVTSSDGTIFEGSFYVRIETVFYEEMRYAAAIYLPLADGRKMLVHGVLMDGPSMILVNVYEGDQVAFQRNGENDCKSALAGIVQNPQGEKSLLLVHNDSKIPSANFPLFID